MSVRNLQCFDDIKALAKRRVPGFVFDYIEEGCNANVTIETNRSALDQVRLMPAYMDRYSTPDLTTSLLGQTYGLPVGIAPLGLSGLIWPKASLIHARIAKQYNIPFVLSTVATVSIEHAARAAGNNFWFQLYPPADRDICLDLMRRAKEAGCSNLIVTVDVPSPSRRIKALHSGLSVPPRITVKNIVQSALRPMWSLATVTSGLPEFVNLTPYMSSDVKSMEDAANFIRTTMRDVVDLPFLHWLREHWDGKLIVKGVLNVADAIASRDAGVDGIIVSNHGGRQLDAAPSPVTQLPAIRQAVDAGVALMIDSGVESGVDVARYLSLGADAVLAGRAFAYGVAAGQHAGVAKTVQLLQLELEQVMSQLHCPTPAKMHQFAASN